MPPIFMNFSFMFFGVTRLKLCDDALPFKWLDRLFIDWTDLIRLDSLIGMILV